MEYLGKFGTFVLNIWRFFYESFFQHSGAFFTRVFEAPGESFFEALFVLFLVACAASVLLGLLLSVIKLSPMPFINSIQTLTRFFAYVGGWLIAILIIAMVYEVIARYFLDAPTSWAFEMAYMLMGTSFMFGIAFCLQLKRHIRVDFVYDNVGDRGRAIIDLLGYVILVPMVVWLCAGLWSYFEEAYRVNELSGESAWNPIIWPFKFAFVIGFVLLLLQIIVEILKCVMALFGVSVPEPKAVEVDAHGH
ncbi:MAG: TRAP transporter small permease subunit [Gammaproteobacteria bacterium]|nr:TRAP transporter small permease subunit [Gammaproteobacteria bacterium]